MPIPQGDYPELEPYRPPRFTGFFAFRHHGNTTWTLPTLYEVTPQRVVKAPPFEDECGPQPAVLMGMTIGLGEMGD